MQTNNLPLTAAPTSDAERAARTEAPRPAPEPLTFGVAEMRHHLHISEATLFRLRAAGKLPRALKLGGRLLWEADEVRRWVKARMPDLKTWEAMEAARRGQRH